MPAEDDILLLQLIKQDDEKAFKHLFDTYFVSLCHFMSLYLRDKQEIEELALSIFMNLWEGRADLTLKISFKAYLFQSARNRCLNRIRFPSREEKNMDMLLLLILRWRWKN